MAGKLETAREYVLANYNNGNDFRWDELSRKLQIKAPSDSAWQDVDTRKINSIACDCATQTGVNVTDREIRIVLNSENIPSINPLRDYLSHLEPYNPTEHNNHSWIDWLSSQVKVKESFSPQGGLTVSETNGLSAAGGLTAQRSGSNAAWQHCFKKWFVAMVASWLYDEVVNQQVLVLIGRQGIYKTTWLERLLPPSLRAYGTKMSNPHDLNKDERMRVAESGLIFMDEMDALTPRELIQMKSMITTTSVDERAAYAYTKEHRVRIASFCGSGNEPKILNDHTGNRRWLMFEVESIVNPFTYDDSIFPYEQIYGEALWLINQHFHYWFDLEDIKEIEKRNEAYMVTANEADLLPVYFAPANPGDAGAVFMTTAEISSLLVSYGNIRNPLALNKLSTIIRQKGYTPRIAHGGLHGFVVYVHKDIDQQRKAAAREASEDGVDGVDGVDVF